MPLGTESAAILIANVSALDRPLSAFVRLKYPTVRAAERAGGTGKPQSQLIQMLYPELPDHPIPVRFVFLLLNSVDNYLGETVAIGRAMGSLLSDEVRRRGSEMENGLR